MVDKKTQNIALFEVALCSVLWSMGGIFIKLVPWNPFVIAGLRAIIAFFTILPYFIITKRKVAINKNTLFHGIFLCATFICFVSANKLTTAANAIVLQYIAPVFVVVISFFFLHIKPKRADLIVIAFTLLGISLFFFDQLDSGHLVGNIVAITAGFSLSLMYIFQDLEGDSADQKLTGILIALLLTFIVGLPFIAKYPLVITTKSIVSIFILGIFQIGIPYILLGLGSRYVGPVACSLLGVFEPLLNPVWVFIFDGEKPGIFALIGAVIILTSITVWCIKKEDK